MYDVGYCDALVKLGLWRRGPGSSGISNRVSEFFANLFHGAGKARTTRPAMIPEGAPVKSFRGGVTAAPREAITPPPPSRRSIPQLSEAMSEISTGLMPELGKVRITHQPTVLGRAAITPPRPRVVNIGLDRTVIIPSAPTATPQSIPGFPPYLVTPKIPGRTPIPQLNVA